MEASRISPVMCQNVMNDFYNRLHKCIKVNGHSVEKYEVFINKYYCVKNLQFYAEYILRYNILKLDTYFIHTLYFMLFICA